MLLHVGIGVFQHGVERRAFFWLDEVVARERNHRIEDVRTGHDDVAGWRQAHDPQ